MLCSYSRRQGQCVTVFQFILVGALHSVVMNEFHVCYKFKTICINCVIFVYHQPQPITVPYGAQSDSDKQITNSEGVVIVSLILKWVLVLNI